MKLALIKKIDFKYNNLIHSALVSIYGTSDEMFVHIQLINSFLRKIFGIEHVRFYHQKGEIRLKEAKHPFAHQIAQLVTLQLSEEIQNTSKRALRAI